MSEENKTVATREALERAIGKFQRKDVLKLLKDGALNGVAGEEKIALYRKLSSLRSMDVIDFLSKQSEPFTAAMLQLDFDVYQNKNFVKEVLAKYGKKFSLAAEEDANALFALACAVDDEKTVKSLLKQKKGAGAYVALGAAAMPVFAQITAMGAELSADDRVALYVQAMLTAEWEEKLGFLLEEKIDVFVKNAEGKTVIDLLEERIKTHKYGKDKKGSLQKIQEERTVKVLQKVLFEQEHPVEEKMPFKKMILIGVICVVAAAIIGTVAGYVYVQNSGSSSEVVEELSVEVEEVEELSY